jgi:TatD DNase family protein
MFIDAHSHVDRYDLVGERALEFALAEIAQHRIFTISNSMDLPSYRRNLEISEKCNLVLPAFGVHPWNAPEYVDRLQDLGEAIEQSPMIGEIGLDHYFEDAATYPDQRKVFEYLLGAAREQAKIITLHTKGAEREVLKLLDQYNILRVIVHWYSGSLDIFRELIDRGAYFTVGIEVLYSKHIQTIAKEIPSGQLLTETDNPGGPKEFIGGAGTPVLVKEVVRGIAEARKTTAEAIVQAVQANLTELIRDNSWLANIYAKALEEQPNGG